MADRIPKNFQQSSDPSVITFNAVDILTGTGYVTLYGGKTDQGYALSNIQFYSQGVGTYENITTTADTLEITANFDVVINKPINVNGKMIVTTPCQLRLGQTNEQIHAYVKVYLKKGSTTIASATGTQADTFDVNDVDVFPTFTTELTIDNERFNRGDTLRVTVEVYAWQQNAGGTPRVILYHDPQGRANDYFLSEDAGAAPADADDTTVMLVQLPVRIDI